MTEQVLCETARIKITVPGQNDVILDVPAYTRPKDQLTSRVMALFDHYVQVSEHEDESLSLADFGLLCLASAATEPFVQSTTNSKETG